MNSDLFHWRSIKTRVTLFTLVLFVLGIWALTFYASRVLREDMQRVLGEQQLSTVSVLANEINGNLSDRMWALETIAKGVTPAIVGHSATLQTLLEQRPLLLALFNGGVWAAGVDGIAIADVPRSAQRMGVNYLSVDFIAAALQQGKATISRPVLGKKRLTPVVAMAVPIRDQQGKVIGVLSGVTDLDKPNFLEKISQNSYGKSGGFILIAPQHKLIVSATDKSRIMQPVPEPGINAMHDQYMKGYDGFGVTVSSRGVQELTAAKAIPAAGWFVVVTLPITEAFAPIDAMLRRLLLGALIFTVLAAALIWWLISRMLQRQFAPLLSVSRAIAAQTNSDQLTQALPVVRQDEIGELIVGFNRLLDTSARREKALANSEALFRTVVEVIPDAIVLHRAGKLLYVNPAGVDMFGAGTEQELIGKPVLELIHPDFHQLVMERVKKGTEQGLAAQRLEEKYIKLDGTVFDAEVQGKPIVLDGVPAILATLRDVTARKQVEAKLQLAASVFTHALEGIMITDPDATIIDVNDAFTRITGYAREDALGLNPRILRSRHHGPEFFADMWRSLSEHGYWCGEVWNRRKDGEVYAEMQAISAVRDAQGNVCQYIAMFSDITERKVHERQLEHIAHFDALTNLPNRVLLADRLQQAMAQVLRRSQQLAVVYLDLDGFKAVNDKHGHAVGDQVLMMLTQRMKESLREGDTLARLGGDEFVAVLIDLENTSDCLPLVNRLLAAAALPMQWGELSLQVSASVGITFYPQAQDIDADQLLRQADQAMYQAKLAGKNRYKIFDSAQDSHLRSHHESLERIRMALVRREFVLHYQPKVNMHSGKVIGVEALIRWQHPEKGLLAPAAFLPVIEDHPLAVAVGEWVIDAALTQVEAWHAVGLDLAVSVNVGARQLQQGDFVERLQAILAAHPKVSPGRLELEVLETSALADMAQVSQVIETCAQLGVMFALDDFGTGYSSLTYLKRLRVTLLKIDQSFVRDMLDDPDDLAILQGVIGLAAAFRRDVIAEGVETVAHGSLLLSMGCELAQGYGISRPMPAEQLPAWVVAWQPDVTWSNMPVKLIR